MNWRAALLIGAFAIIGNSANAAPLPTLQQAVNHRFLIGASIMSKMLDDPARAQLLSTEFDQITAENELKPSHVHPQQDMWNFKAADRIADFASKNKMKLVGHTLLWHQQTPLWMFEDTSGKPLSRDIALANLKSHIEGVIGHMKGKVIGWDVVNEAISDQDNEYLRPTPALKAIGEDYIIKAFEYAHAADPTVELYYNDYNIEQPAKRQRALKLLQSLIKAGVRIDAVGIQCHWNVQHVPLKEFEESIKLYSALGLKVMVTELDIDVLPRKKSGADITQIEESNNPYPNSCPPELLKKQADEYKSVFEVILKHQKNISRVTFWNLTDKESWLNDFPTKGRTNYPLLFDRNCQPKPGFNAVMDALGK